MMTLSTAWFPWLVFLYLSVLLAMQYGLPAPLGRALLSVIWFLILLACVLRLV